MKRDNWPVEEHGIRPAGHPNHCFYCQEPKGGEHDVECVIRERTVVIRMVVEYVIDVPEHWTPKDIEFHRNDGSWCADNALEELAELRGEDGCICSLARFEYVREATGEDEQESGVFVAKLPT